MDREKGEIDGFSLVIALFHFDYFGFTKEGNELKESKNRLRVIVGIKLI